MMKKIQIGIMGSAADLNYGKDAEYFSKKFNIENSANLYRNLINRIFFSNYENYK